MKNYASENAYFRLPFEFDKKVLKTEFEKCKEFSFLANYVPDNYDGDKYILPLRSINGSMEYAFAVPSHGNEFKDTEALEVCDYIKEVVSQFKCEKEAIRIMRLPSGRVINEHTDDGCSYEDGLFRIHIPIITNDKVQFIVNRTKLNMKEGEVWYANFALAHSVKNESEGDRVHLVMDCIRNEWSDQLFKEMGFSFEQEKPVEEKHSPEVLKRIIEELEKQDGDAAKELIKSYKNQL